MAEETRAYYRWKQCTNGGVGWMEGVGGELSSSCWLGVYKVVRRRLGPDSCQSSCRAYIIKLFHRTMIGPEAVHLGPSEVADSLGCSWLGAVRLESSQQSGFRFNQVVRVFDTGLVNLSTPMNNIVILQEGICKGCHCFISLTTPDLSNW